MAADFTKPVEDSVAKVDNEIAVGEDLEFQHRWWKFERVVWSLFCILLALDVSGLLGRGPLAHARSRASDGSMAVKYDRIERTGTPAMMDISFGPNALHDGRAQLYVSETMVKQLGTQRVVPAPMTTEIGHGGLTYTFPASAPPASVQFALEPPAPGVYTFTLQIPGAQAVHDHVIVVP